MWDDPKALNAFAATLATIASLLLAAGAIAWLARNDVFAFREVVLTAPPARANPADIDATIRGELSGTFFTLDLERARAALQKVAWVRSATLRRHWPGRLEVALEEQEPYARWGEGALVNPGGEIFVAAYDGELPRLEGPDARAADVTSRFREWGALLAPLGLELRAVALSARGGWRLSTVASGSPLAVDLGRDDVDARLARFAAAYGRTVGALARAGTRVEGVDLRYRNGFAARVPGFREKPARPAPG